MTDQYPITPPHELLQEWRHSWLPSYGEFVDYVATQAAQWGADQELDACCEWLTEYGWSGVAKLRAARRLKPPSLKEQALEAMHRNWNPHNNDDFATIRRALEALPNEAGT
jgi:hypothetical protein